MSSSRVLALLLVGVLVGGASLGAAPLDQRLSAAPAAAQESTPVFEQHRNGHDRATPDQHGQSPCSDRFDGTAAIRSLTPEQVGQIERGDGAGFALPAELNGVPGPRHVLDLAAELGLTGVQEARVQGVFDRMRPQAISAGERYLDAVLDVERGFRDGTFSATDLATGIAEVKRLEGELATTHLVAHLEMAEILSQEQIVAYGRLRGYE